MLRSIAGLLLYDFKDVFILNPARKLVKVFPRERTLNIEHSTVAPGRSVASSGCSQRQVFVGCPYFPNAARKALVNMGTISSASPTIPYVATLKIGAEASRLMATMMSADDMPARCWIWPLMPQAM